MTTRRLLFTGYAPVHFACFQPIMAKLADRDDVEIFVSGGTRIMSPQGVRYDHELLYSPFALPDQTVLPVEAVRHMAFDLYFSACTGRIEPRSFDRSVQIFHGMSFRNLAIREEIDGFDDYFLIGPYMRRGFADRGILAAGDPRAVSIGFPKTDRLLDGSLDREELLAEHAVTGDRPIVLYAPTGGKGNSLESIGPDVVRKLAALERYDVLVKLHDHPKGWTDWYEQLSPLESEHVHIVRQPDVVRSMYIADLLISDASSVSNEFALLDRPMVFLDVPELIAAAQASGALVDLDTWGRKGGQVVATADAAVEAVGEGLAHPDHLGDMRRAMVEDLFYYPGHAAGAAVGWVERTLELT